MSKYEIGWYTEGYIVHLKIKETLSSMDLGEYDRACIAYLDQAKGNAIHFILEISEGLAPPKISHMTATTLKSVIHPAHGWTIIFGEISPPIRTVITIALAYNYSGSRYGFKFVNSREEAVCFLQYMLPDRFSNNQVFAH